MVVLRHLDGSDPNIEFCNEESGPGSAVTMHFNARSPKAAHGLVPELPSVVVRDAQLASRLSSAETTYITRPRGWARWLSPKLWVITLENHWVFVALGLLLVSLLFVATRMRGY